MKTIYFAFGLILTACGHGTYQLDTTFSCEGKYQEVRYTTYMFGTRTVHNACKQNVGSCWGDPHDYDPQTLQNLKCHRLQATYNSRWESLTAENDTECVGENLRIQVNKDAIAASLEVDGVITPMTCSGRTVYRDESG